MHIRMLTQDDIPQIIEVIHEVYSSSDYARGAGPLSVEAVSRAVTRSIMYPDDFPCFVMDGDDEIAGIIFGFALPNYFTEQVWFEERVFYIRPKYRSYRNARLLIKTVEEWCAERGVKRIEFGNAASRDPRIDTMFRRLGYEQVNVTHAKRL